ncbi:MAG: hypothetical protein AAGJ46_13665 [Planctomycetota bacterium]
MAKLNITDHARTPAPGEVLDHEYLPVRAKLLEVAASLDRVARAEGASADDPRRRQIDEALKLLLEDGDSRAERMQLLFSLPYDDGWRDRFGL